MQEMNWISLKHAYYIPSEDFMSMLALLHLSSLIMTGFGVLRHSKGIYDIRVHVWALYLAALLFILSLVLSRRRQEEKDEAYMSTSGTYSKVLKFTIPLMLLFSIASLITFAAFHGIVTVFALHLTLICFVLTGFPRLLLCILTISGIVIGTGFQMILIGFLYGRFRTRKSIVDLSTDFRYGIATRSRIVFMDMILLILQAIGGSIFYSNHWKLGYLISRYKARPAYFISNIIGVTEIEHALMTKCGYGFEESINYSDCISNLSPRVDKVREEQPSHAAQAPSIDECVDADSHECVDNPRECMNADSRECMNADSRECMNGHGCLAENSHGCPAGSTHSCLPIHSSDEKRVTYAAKLRDVSSPSRSLTPGAILTCETTGTFLSQSTRFTEKGTDVYDYPSIDGYFSSCPEEDEDEEWVKLCNENIVENKRRVRTVERIKLSHSFGTKASFAYIDARFQSPRREKSATLYESRTGISDGQNLDFLRRHDGTRIFTRPLFSRDALGSLAGDSPEMRDMESGPVMSRNIFGASLVSGDTFGMGPLASASIDYSDNLQLRIKNLEGTSPIVKSVDGEPRTSIRRIDGLEASVPPIEYKLEHSSKHTQGFPDDGMLNTPSSGDGQEKSSPPDGDEKSIPSSGNERLIIPSEKRVHSRMDTILSKYSDYRMLSMPLEGLFHSASLTRELEEMNEEMTVLRDVDASVTNPFLKFLYLLLPKCVKDALDVCGGKYEKLKGKREIMQKSKWPQDLLMPSRNTLDMFHSPSIETFYVHWMDSFNAYFYGITKKETFSICAYSIVASVVLCLRHVFTMDNMDAAKFLEGHRIILLISRYVLQALVDLLCMIPIFRTSWKVHNKSDMRKTYFLMLFMCVFQYLLNVFDLCMYIGLKNPGYAVYNTIIMSLLLTKTSALLILRLPTYVFLYTIYFFTFLLIHTTYVKHKIYRWLLMEVFSQLIIGAGTYCFCSRPIDTNRRLLFSMYILPYITYLNRRFNGDSSNEESRGYGFDQGDSMGLGASIVSIGTNDGQNGHSCLPDDHHNGQRIGHNEHSIERYDEHIKGSIGGRISPEHLGSIEGPTKLPMASI